MTPKQVIAVGALAVAAMFVLFLVFGNDPITLTCEPGYTRVGEGCMSMREECEGRGDEYFFDETKQRCFATD
jgi:hypothetical protein